MTMSTTAIRAPLVALACALTCVTAASAQSPAAGPFAKLPALPTACYLGDDPFSDQVAAATDATQADIERQKAINQQIEDEFNNIDPMVKAQKMQQWMMSNPQEAMKWAQAQQQLGADTQTVGPELNASALQFENEKKSLVAGYEAALKQAAAPADARMEAMNAKLGPNGCGVGDTECSPEPWVVEEYNAIQKLRDTGYQGVCATYWSATGQVPGYLKRYRDWLTTKWIPSWIRTDEARVSQYAIMNTPAASWKSTIPQESALKYMETARGLYANRRSKPLCDAQGCN
jgi:hypothetical protein